MNTAALLKATIEELLDGLNPGSPARSLPEYESLRQLHRVGDSCYSQYKEELIASFEVIYAYSSAKHSKEMLREYIEQRDAEV